MKPAEPFILVPDEPASRTAGGRADSLAVRVAAAVVLFTAAASIVWYCLDAVLAL